MAIFCIIIRPFSFFLILQYLEGDRNDLLPDQKNMDALHSTVWREDERGGGGGFRNKLRSPLLYLSRDV